MESISLIVGLGNPGTEYHETRHNAGAELVEQLAAQFSSPLVPNKNYFGLYSKVLINGKSVHLLVPTTFMNRSGKSVAALANFFKIPVQSILVAHDELDLPPGVSRLKRGGGHGGHNGLRDIIASMGNNKDFYRLRLGIGHPGSAQQVAGFVLRKAPLAERNATQQAIDETLRYIPMIVSGDHAKAMNTLHSFNASAK
jgi:PTH1 family peptidyl-tRNA hydrolase